jgi:hypothetical protein
VRGTALLLPWNSPSGRYRRLCRNRSAVTLRQLPLCSLQVGHPFTLHPTSAASGSSLCASQSLRALYQNACDSTILPAKNVCVLHRPAFRNHVFCVRLVSVEPFQRIRPHSTRLPTSGGREGRTPMRPLRSHPARGCAHSNGTTDNAKRGSGPTLGITGTYLKDV